ncbi:hypothetical protein AKJ16_DCAP06884 [Drosera capensis]
MALIDLISWFCYIMELPNCRLLAWQAAGIFLFLLTASVFEKYDEIWTSANKRAFDFMPLLVMFPS